MTTQSQKDLAFLNLLLLKFDTLRTQVKQNLVYLTIAFDKLSYLFFWEIHLKQQISKTGKRST